MKGKWKKFLVFALCASMVEPAWNLLTVVPFSSTITVMAAEAAQVMETETERLEALEKKFGAAENSSELKKALANMKEKEKRYKTAQQKANTLQKEKEKADQAVNDAEDALGKANEALSAAGAEYAQYKRGSYGFIEWMMKKENLSKIQRQDLELAKGILDEAMKEDFSKWLGGDDVSFSFLGNRNGKVVCLSDEKDAVSLNNMRNTFETLYNINSLRKSDENYNNGTNQYADAFTNFYFMAVAQTGADRGAGLYRHSSLVVSCENLSFRSTDPIAGWYNGEKIAFNQIRDQLGYTPPLTSEQIKAIDNTAMEQGFIIGHYTNLFWDTEQVMGIGYTPYGGNVFCYNAGCKSDYEDDEYNRGRHMYTVQEFESLLNAYYQTVDVSGIGQAAFNARVTLNEKTAIQSQKSMEFAYANREERETAEAFYEARDTYEALLKKEDETSRKITKIAIKNPLSSKIAAAKKVKLEAQIFPSNAANKRLSWSSSNPNYASVNSSGLVTTKKAGKGKSVVITAKARDGSGKKGSIKLRIVKGTVKKIRLNAPKKVDAGTQVRIKAKITASAGANKSLSYSVNKSNYAKINNKGLLTTKVAGKGKKIKVTAKATDGSNKKSTITILIQ